jgi:hypothetical protein
MPVPATGKMDTAGKSVGESRSATDWRASSKNWTFALGLGKKLDTPACRGVRQGSRCARNRGKKWFALRCRFTATALRFRIASRDPAAQRDFRCKQAAEKGKQR